MSRIVTSLLCLASYALTGASSLPAQGAAGTALYVLRPGDRIDISYTYTPEYNQSVPVGPDGVVSLTRLGPVEVAGLTLAQAKARLTTAAVHAGLNQPVLFLTLTDYLRPQITVLGEVFKPGRYDVRGSLRFLDGLALAGGLNPNGRRKNIILIRPIDSTEGVTTLINYKALEKGNKEVSFQDLQPGDIIIVPATNLSKVERFIKLINVGVFYNPVP